MSEKLIELIESNELVDAGKEFEVLMAESVVEELASLRSEVATTIGVEEVAEAKKCEEKDCDDKDHDHEDKKDDDEDVKEEKDHDSSCDDKDDKEDKKVEEKTDCDDDDDEKDEKKEKYVKKESVAEKVLVDHETGEVTPLKEEKDTYRVIYRANNGRQGTHEVKADSLKEARIETLNSLNKAKRNSAVHYRIVDARKV